MENINKDCVIEYYYLDDDGIFPNSPLPALLYKSVINLTESFPSLFIGNLFSSNNWRHAWDAGIFEYNHYHSITHEVLGIYEGKTTLLLGGDSGMKVDIEKGDVLIIPAGVAHKNLLEENAVKCIGAYPDGLNYDMNYGRPTERPFTDIKISKVLLPSKDPVFGSEKGIEIIWK